MSSLGANILPADREKVLRAEHANDNGVREIEQAPTMADMLEECYPLMSIHGDRRTLDRIHQLLTYIGRKPR